MSVWRLLVFAVLFTLLACVTGVTAALWITLVLVTAACMLLAVLVARRAGATWPQAPDRAEAAA